MGGDLEKEDEGLVQKKVTKIFRGSNSSGLVVRNSRIAPTKLKGIASLFGQI